MDQPGPSQSRQENSEEANYSLEVVRVEDIRKSSKRGELYVEVKVDGLVHRTGDLNEDGKPVQDAILTFSQTGSASVFDICVKKMRKHSRQDRLLGHAQVKEDVPKLLQEYLPYELKRKLARTVRSLLRKQEVTAGTIHLRLNLTGAWQRARLCVSSAERMVENIKTTADKVTSVDSTIGTIIQAVDQIKEIVDTVAEIHPLVTLGWKAVSALYSVVSYQFKADTNLVDAVDKMKEAFNLSAEADRLVDRTNLLKLTIKELLNEATECSRFVQQYAAHSFAGRLAHWTESQRAEMFASRFVDLRNKLDSIINMNAAKGIDDVEAWQLLETLYPTKMDISKMSTRPRCLEGTRRDYVKEILSVLLPGTGKAGVTNSDKRFVWLTGAAGAGKSTIALTIADTCDSKGFPAACLFFERGKDEYVSAIRGIAYRLATLHPTIRSHIAGAVRDNNNIIGSPFRIQFEKLLLEPIQALVSVSGRPFIIILDALDECGTSRQREDLVRVLTTNFKSLPSEVRVLVTSRPEVDIMKHLSLKSHFHCIELEHTSEGSRRGVDIYIRERMKAIVEQGPPEGWEWDGVCKVLSDAADGLFIWASTAVKMVAETNNPRRELRTLLEDIHSVGGGIDSLYATVLEQSGIPWHKREAKEEFEKILGVVLFVKEALSGEEIEAFLGLEEDTAGTVLRCLRSVLLYNLGKPVHLHHASFADYLTSERSSGKPWNINDSSRRQCITERCFDVMNENLKFNICGIETSFLRNDDISDLQSINSDLSSFLWAAYRLASVFLCPISQSAPQIYLSAISLWEGESCVADHYSVFHPIVLVERYGKKPTAQYIKILTGHFFPVNSVVFSSDRKRIASGSSDNTVRIWDADSGEVVSGPFKHADDVNSVAFSPDDRLVASGTDNGTVCVWNVDSGELALGPLEGHTNPVRSVVFSPDGKRIGSGSGDKTIRVWDAESGGSVGGPFEGHIDGVNSVVFSRDGDLIASGSFDKMIRVWDSESGKLVAGPFEGHTDKVWSVDFSPDGRRIASGSRDGAVRMWDVNSGKQIIRPIEGHTGAITSVVFSPDGKHIASGSGDKTICTWGADSGELVTGPFKGHSSWVNSVAFSPDGKRIVSGSFDFTIRIWDAEGGKFDSDGSEALSDPVNSIAFSPDGTCIASGSDDNAIRVWSVENGKLVSGPFKVHTAPVLSVAYSPNGKRVVSGSRDKTVRVWDTDSGEFVSGLFQGHSNAVRSVAFSSNGKLVASGFMDGTICVRGVDSGKMVMGPFKGHTDNILSISISPDGRFIASSSLCDETFRVWDVGSGKPISHRFEGHTEAIRSLSFSPDGRLIASGSTGTIRIWNANSGERLLNLLRGHVGWVQSVTFSPNGKFIASGSGDKSICIWAVDDGRLVRGPLKGHLEGVRTVAFSPSGKYLASGSEDGMIRVWSLNNIELKASSSGAESSSISSPDRSSRADKEHMISNWSLSEDGWVLGPGGELLTWVPEDMRSTLSRPGGTVVIGQGFSTRLDLVNSPLGEDWCKGF